jgi:hypothetical protein
MNRYRPRLVYLVLCTLFSLSAFSGDNIRIKKNWFIVNKERFLIKGIGYSNCRPHEQPNSKKIDLDQEREDFKLIREAGFNTIRTWKPLTLEELKLAEEFGLYVIQGSWIEYRQNYGDIEYAERVAETLRNMANESKAANNVLMFLVGNEPQPRQVFSVGLEKTNRFFKLLKRSIKKMAPKIPVTMSNWVQSDFLDDSMWDVLAVNIYIYNPESVSHAMGYRGYTNWLKRERAEKRPFIVTETGLSVSKTGVGHKGYGGNSLEEQKTGVMYMYREALNAGATGVCIFEWIDEWWKNFNHPNDKDIHEPADPEEWFGICYYDEDGNIHKRPVYEALKKFNQAVCVTPKDSAVVTRKFPVKVYVEESISGVAARLGADSEWVMLKRRSPHWFTGKISLKKIPDGKQRLFIRAKSFKEGEEFKAEKTIYVNKKRRLNAPLSVRIILDKDTYYTQNKMSTVRIRFLVEDAQGNPVPGRKITAAIYEPVLNQRLILNLESGEDGMATHIYNINEEGVLTVSAGVEAFPEKDPEEEDPKLRIKNGDCKHIHIYYDKKK